MEERPRNVSVELENPDVLVSPPTDAGTVANLKFPYALAHNRVLSGGWAREITKRELPIATEVAGVNMRLTPGGIRELHWHKEAEWAYVIAGSCRISILDEQRRLFLDDVSVDALPTDIAHTRYMFAGDVPPALGDDAPPYPATEPPWAYTWHMHAQEPTKTPGGQVRITDSRNFTISERIAAALVEIEPGGMRELHWHPNADEWQYYLNGQGRMTVFASGGKARTFDCQAGDVGYVPFAMGHYVENTGEETLTFLEMFRSDHFADVSLSQWMGVLPPELVKAHLNLDDAVIAALPRTKPIAVRQAS